MVPNRAGGHGFALDDWTRLDRFLILGSEGGSYYASARTLTVEAAEAVRRAIAADAPRAVARIVEISDSGRAPRNDPTLFALAMAAAADAEETRRAALAALPRVASIGTHLFRFAEYVEGFRGWGRGLRRAVARWYVGMPLDRLVWQVIRYRGRAVGGDDGGGTRWSHRDLLRLAHPVTDAEDRARRALFERVTRPESDAPLPAELVRLAAAEELSRTWDVARAIQLVTLHRLPREVVPTALRRSPAVWDALLADMPMTAMLRTLGRMSSVGLLTGGSDTAREVAARLGDTERLRRARVHPLAILLALATYEQGRGVRGSLEWEPATEVVDALDRAFFAALAMVAPTGRRLMLALDVSGSMGLGQVAGTPLTPRVAAAAMALVTATVEERAQFRAFSDRLVPVSISPRQRLDDVLRRVDDLRYGVTDCGLPMVTALREKLPVDAFVVYTDHETWAGANHPVRALRAYRDKMGIPARLVVVGMVSNGFTIADPEDGGMLDVVGFDAATPAVIADFVAGRV